MTDTNKNGPTHQGALKVEDFMVHDPITVTPASTVHQAIQVLLTKKISSLPIVNVNQGVVSIVSGVDLMKFAALGAMDKPLVQFLDKLVKSDKIIGVRKNDSFTDTFKQFLTHQVRLLVVTDGTGKLLGVVTRSSILKILEESHHPTPAAAPSQKGTQKP